MNTVFVIHLHTSVFNFFSMRDVPTQSMVQDCVFLRVSTSHFYRGVPINFFGINPTVGFLEIGFHYKRKCSFVTGPPF